MKSSPKAVTLAALFAVLCALLLFSWLVLETGFPIFGFNAPKLVKVEDMGGIAGLVSKFLWEHRGLDLLIQAFVIVATIVCCMAMLKPGREE